MSTTYAQRQTTAQKKDASSAASVFDSSSQSESLQRKADMANNAAQRVDAPRPNNTGMPDNLKSGIESLSGFSMDDVRVHYNSSKPATVQALAYTQGTDIHVAPGQEKHLPHEAWHVAQQMAGRVSPTTNINGMPVNDNAALEHEADVMGEKAVQCKGMENLNFTDAWLQNSTVQRMAYAKNNEDGTVSAETDQYEGNENLARLFGRKPGPDGKYKRPENVARKVDQYKREMLTYIASCIQEQGEKNNCDYGPHISVVITRGIWFIAINSDYVKNKNVKTNLFMDAAFVKKQIMAKWNILYENFNSNTNLKADETGKVSDDLAKNQALYIVYRWAGKNNGIVVEQNQACTDGVKHGEMQTIDFLNQENSKPFTKASSLFKSIESIFSIAHTEIAAAGKVAATAAETEVSVERKSENVESDADNRVAVARYYAAINAADYAAAAATAADTEVHVKSEAADRAANVAKNEEILAERESENVDSDADNRVAVARYYAAINAADYAAAAQKVREALPVVHEALSILMYCKKSNDLNEKNRVVRVGGSKTPCFDCAYEMNVHDDYDSKIDGCETHKGHDAAQIGNRTAITMTPNFGKAFYMWKFHGKKRPELTGERKTEVLSFDSLQNQDYNELYNSFNMLNLKEKNPSESVLMKITSPMEKVWLERMKLQENNNSISDKYKINIDKLSSLDKEKSLKFKDLFLRDLDANYKLNSTQKQKENANIQLKNVQELVKEKQKSLVDISAKVEEAKNKIDDKKTKEKNAQAEMSACKKKMKKSSGKSEKSQLEILIKQIASLKERKKHWCGKLENALEQQKKIKIELKNGKKQEDEARILVEKYSNLECSAEKMLKKIRKQMEEEKKQLGLEFEMPNIGMIAIKFDRFAIRRLDLNIQGSLAYEIYEASEINQSVLNDALRTANQGLSVVSLNFVNSQGGVLNVIENIINNLETIKGKLNNANIRNFDEGFKEKLARVKRNIEQKNVEIGQKIENLRTVQEEPDLKKAVAILAKVCDWQKVAFKPLITDLKKNFDELSGALNSTNELCNQKFNSIPNGKMKGILSECTDKMKRVDNQMNELIEKVKKIEKGAVESAEKSLKDLIIPYLAIKRMDEKKA